MQTLNIIGLLFDISGVILLFIYGLPTDVIKDGIEPMHFGTKNKKEAEKYIKYKKRSRFALVLILAGFILQILANTNCFK
jgi:hypothetical protein